MWKRTYIDDFQEDLNLEDIQILKYVDKWSKKQTKDNLKRKMKNELKKNKTMLWEMV